MTLVVRMPAHCPDEFSWVCSVVLGERLGLEYRIEQGSDHRIRIERGGRCLSMPDVFLAKASTRWLERASLPEEPFSAWSPVLQGLDAGSVSEPLPVLFGHPLAQVGESEIRLDFDLFGTVFFLLSRYEEAVLQERDSFDRFPATASIAGRAGFLHRPLADECVEVLRACIRHLWPDLPGKPHASQNRISCDVDHPYVCDYASIRSSILRAGSDLILRGSPRLALQTTANALRFRRGRAVRDPYHEALDWIMEVNEQAGNRVAFHFIADRTDSALDGCYRLSDPGIRTLLRRISERGHEIALHPGYHTYRNPERIRVAAQLLRTAMDAEGIRQEGIGARQHYLRWRTPDTARGLESADLAYDSTLGFADCAGFRCGTCHEFPMYDPVERRPLRLRQRPLLVMESSVMSKAYMNLGHSPEALATMNRIKSLTRRFGGDFTLLWHNSRFSTQEDRRFYLDLIA